MDDGEEAIIVAINNFRGEYFFLSNFYEDPEHSIEYDGVSFKSVEAAFQSAKVRDKQQAARFVFLSAAQAKKLGRKVRIRDDWEKVKLDIMTSLIVQKFTKNTLLKEKLLATGDEELIEGNTWGDTFWGVDAKSGRGLNYLGKILMEVRRQLREQEDLG